MKQVISAEDTAFIESTKNVFEDMVLKPWTPERIIAAQSMGMLYPDIGDEGIDQFNRTGLYPGTLKDVIIALWLCTINEEPDPDPKKRNGMTVLDAMDSSKEALRLAIRWAAEKKIVRRGSDEFWSAYGMFSKLQKQVKDSETQPIASQVPVQENEDPNE